MINGVNDDLHRPVRKIGGQELDVNCWSTPDVGAFNEATRKQYLARQDAVTLYLNGAPDALIRQRSGIGAKQAYRLIRERCLQTHPDGQVYGWRGLIPHMRVHPYRRRKKLRVDNFGLGAAGAMQLLLEGEPELAKAFVKRILKSGTGKKLSQIHKPRDHVAWFVGQLRERGYEARNEWPFNTASNGYFAVYRYFKSVLAENPRAAARAAGGPDLEKKLLSGDGVDRPVKHVFERVEMDAHKLDARLCVMVPQLDGDWVPKIIHRLWVIVILDVASRAVLGYHLSLRREVSKDDVLKAIKRALTKWTKRELHFSDVPYQPGAALPSGVRDDWVGLCWDETSVDGALAETCKTVRSVLKDVVGSELLDPDNSFAVRRSKDDRPFIESFFRTLGERGFQRLSNTTGGKPQDKRGRDPDEVALTSQFQYEYAEELLDVLIANYNAKEHRNLGSRSPLQFMDFASSRTDFSVRRADSNLVGLVVSYRKRCVVRGGAAEGRAPFVNFQLAKYSNEMLSNRHDLVGTEVWVTNHLEDDARLAMCSTLNGQSLGILRASPPWHKLPHSLAVRSASCAAARRGMFSFTEGADGVETFMNFVERQPNKKLPVHPAYLEARRILVAAAEEVAGEDMVTISKAKAKSAPVAATDSPGKRTKAVSSGSTENSPDNVRKLPARRMTAI